MKKRIIYILLFSVFILPGLFCSEAKYQKRTAIIYAFKAEGELLRENMDVEDSLIFCGRTFWMGELEENEVIVVNSGVGMTNSAMTTQLIIDEFKPERIIFTGICGGIDPDNDIGDIVIPEKWATHDYGYYGKDGFLIMPIRVKLPEKEKQDTLVFFEVDKGLLDKAEAVVSQAKKRFQKILDRTPQLKIGGVGVSGNSFIDQVEKREWLKEKLDAQIVDMESAAAVQVAKQNGIPILVVRSCSDLAGGSGSSTAEVEIGEFFKVAADNSAGFVLELLKELDSF
ncbi:MAG: hypothetical protein AMJ90_06005 [candidate division Zixibacteria bacterium SM23_73_2]|nr:MAG: hypothetical protein AMJ90_06005 [candidate division Zixibacteria bacterium SM23_73_2]